MDEGEVAEGIARSGALAAIGVTVEEVRQGRVRFSFAAAPSLTQQDGFVHAGVMTTVVDSACGFAAATLMPPGSRVLTVEFKVNFMAPAAGSRFVCTGTVIRAGRTLSVCEGRVEDAETGREVARMQATMMRLASDAD